jgi:orotidine-5'-phosphate decarboxylase
MTKAELFRLICEKRSFLCVGLDPELSKIPQHLLAKEDPIFEFNKAIIDATIDLAVAYKPNLAFYETQGIKGWQSLEKTIAHLKQKQGKAFIIADAKRGDIGNTSGQYAKAFFSNDKGLDVDAITIAPYMGEDSVSPFLGFDGKWVILLALTSNKGAFDFQFLETKAEGAATTKKLFEVVLERSSRWGSAENMMYVVGATQATMLGDIRKIVPNHFLLVPGVGAQGGSLKEVATYGMNAECGLLVNASRSILFASPNEDFAEKAKAEVRNMQKEMEELLKNAGII